MDSTNVPEPLRYPVLPLEIWIIVAQHLTSMGDLAALASVSRAHHDVLNSVLYRVVASSDSRLRAIFWGVVHDLPRTVSSCLVAGIDVNSTWENQSGHRGKPNDIPAHGDTGTEITMPGALYSTYWSPIHVAAAHGNAEILDILLRNGALPDKACHGMCRCHQWPLGINVLGSRSNVGPGPPDWTPFHMAICSGPSLSAVGYLLQHVSMDVESVERQPDRTLVGLTPLHTACIAGRVDIIKWLLNDVGGIDLESRDNYNRQTPLACAYLYGNQACFDYLLSRGADINTTAPGLLELELEDPDFMPPVHKGTLLYHAIACRRFKQARNLIERGADPVLADRLRGAEKPLIHLVCSIPWNLISNWSKASDKEDGVELLDCLLSLGLDFNTSSEGHTALGHAAGATNTEAVRRLAQAGALVDGDPEKDRCTPLAYACEDTWNTPLLELVELLINLGASPNAIAENTVSPLWNLSSICDGKPDTKEVTELLLRHGSTPGRGNGSTTGPTILSEFPFAMNEDRETTALEQRLKDKNLEEFKMLLGHYSPSEAEVLTFWEIACDKKDPETARYLLSWDQDCTIARLAPHPLVRFLSADTGDILVTLLEQGADPHLLWFSYDPLEYMLAQWKWPLSAKLPVFQALMEAGCSIHKPLELLPRPGRIIIATPLGLAIQGLEPYTKIVDCLLEHQPLRSHGQALVGEYISEACCLGNAKALQAIIRSTEAALPIIERDAIGLIHSLLDNLTLRQTCVRDMMATIDCLELLLKSGAVDITSDQSGNAHHETIKDKLLEYTHTPPLLGKSTADRAAAWCFQQRMELGVLDEAVTFKPQIMSMYFQLNLGVHQVGRIVGHPQRQLKIIPIYEQTTGHIRYGQSY
ncbi:unnamed protein product [Clonostachys rosea f. rosea IK726]|uniref:Uncharacterized protein n=1 Tax=Clonostachys rosea f. rosea IK726 TaxID=1349383 RepID=A0ACA9TV62_BIOOC|nr:unnamed protein product [Clonostachys rosea f. rosea IK726]